jgi:hypothetical protein
MSNDVIYHTRDGQFKIIGLDDAVKRKALELVAIDPDMPRGLMEGLLYYTWLGHFVCCDSNAGHGHWYIQTVDPQSKLHPNLEGKWTSRMLAQSMIEKFADPKVIEAGERVFERKRLKREQEKANGSRDHLPKDIEEKKILDKAFRESLKRTAE